MACQICGRGNIAVVLCGSCVPNPIPPTKTRKRTTRRSKHRAKGEFCFYCGTTEYLTTDHVIPISRGGTNNQSNLVRACNDCNSDKGDLLLEEYRKKCGGITFPGEKLDA